RTVISDFEIKLRAANHWRRRGGAKIILARFVAMKQVQQSAREREAGTTILRSEQFEMRVWTELYDGQVGQPDGGAASILGANLIAGIETAIRQLRRGEIPHGLSGARHFHRALDHKDLNGIGSQRTAASMDRRGATEECKDDQRSSD